MQLENQLQMFVFGLNNAPPSLRGPFVSGHVGPDDVQGVVSS